MPEAVAEAAADAARPDEIVGPGAQHLSPTKTAAQQITRVMRAPTCRFASKWARSGCDPASGSFHEKIVLVTFVVGCESGGVKPELDLSLIEAGLKKGC